MLPTVVFKCRTLVLFTVLGELFALVIPDHINVSLKIVLEKAKFNEFYCVCGSSTDTEQQLMSHVRGTHPFIYKLFMFLRNCHLPLSVLNMGEILQEQSDQLGSI